MTVFPDNDFYPSDAREDEGIKLISVQSSNLLCKEPFENRQKSGSEFVTSKDLMHIYQSFPTGNFGSDQLDITITGIVRINQAATLESVAEVSMDCTMSYKTLPSARHGRGGIKKKILIPQIMMKGINPDIRIYSDEVLGQEKKENAQTYKKPKSQNRQRKN